MKEEIVQREKTREMYLTYSTDEWGDEEPAVLQHIHGRISYHVLDVIKKTVCTCSIVVILN